ncbi:hypothetical protein DL98DRAFT_581811 [Cadophora sp. DSE1049]|nr:hypothetical protein DL98DRAFT_581811 [Cadophora sp. DSE1049]
MANLDETTPKPIVFNARGLEVVTRLIVFDTVFHVSSTILKMHSQYFYKFLDSTDKAAGTGHGGFKYDWVTKIVDDGKDWQLVCAGPNTGDLNLVQWKKTDYETYIQRNAFHSILKAMYMLPYVLIQVHDLFILTGLARFYMCLPLISRTLDGAMARSHALSQHQVRSFCSELLSVATELRHKALFKDSLIHCLGPFSSPGFEKVTDKKLKRLAQSHYHKLRSDILEELYTILYSMIQEGINGDKSIAANDAYGDLTSAWFKRGIALEAQKMDDGHEVYLPRLFRGMLEDERLHEPFILEKLDYVLRNDLTIGLGISEEAGKGNYEDYFLLTTIDDDEDYPWDATVDDW